MSWRINSKFGSAEQMLDVGLLAGEEIVEADHVVTFVDHAFAEVRTEKPGPTGDENAFDATCVTS